MRSAKKKARLDSVETSRQAERAEARRMAESERRKKERSKAAREAEAVRKAKAESKATTCNPPSPYAPTPSATESASKTPTKN